MNRTRLALAAMVLGLAAAFGAPDTAMAKGRGGAATVATPIGSPGEWLSPEDYPVAALRHDITGITVFRLSVDAEGRPSGCEITVSSQFDVLDEATCERLMRNARFTPARDAAGRAVAGTYSSRVRWVLPPDGNTFREGALSLRLEVDAAGKLVSCRMLEGRTDLDGYDPCRGMSHLPLEAGMAMRGSSVEPVAEIAVEMSNGYGAGPPPERVSAVAGYERRALFVTGFTLNAEGKLTDCRMTEQRGTVLLIDNFCLGASSSTFDPPFDAVGADGTVRGWTVGRILLRTAR